MGKDILERSLDRLDNISGIMVMGCGGFIVFGFLLFVLVVIILSFVAIFFMYP
jgi:hypothetical protein